MATQKFTNFDKIFLMHADMTAATIKSNKIALNEVKDNSVLLEASHGKKPCRLLVQPSIISSGKEKYTILLIAWNKGT